jgi:hypothetical protein
MSEWWTYRPSDFLLFSHRVYERLIESHNAGLWPWQLVALAAGLLVIGFAGRARPRHGRFSLALVGAGLLFSGWSFLWSRYANINWAAAYAAPGFWIVGVGFLAAAFLREPLKPPSGLTAALALAMLGLAIVVYPLAALVAGKPRSASEVAGIMPDPTALAALAIVVLIRPWPIAAALSLAPFLWSLYAAMTLWTLNAPEAWIVMAGLIAFAVAIAMRSGAHHKEPKPGSASYREDDPTT